MRENRLTLIVAAAVLLVLLLRMTVYTVQDSEVAVVLTFGDPSSERTEPGPGVKLPWPIQQVRRFDNRLRVLKGPLVQLATRDEQAILVGSFVLWRIASARTFLETVGDEEAAERRIEELLRSHQAAAISATRFGQLVSADRKALSYEQVEEQMRAGLSKEAQPLGIEVAMVGIRRLGLPKEVTLAVFERMRKEREKIASDIESLGKAEAERIRAKAEELRGQRIRNARIKAREILADAEAEARPEYEAMAVDPQLAVFLKKLEALKKMLSSKGLTLVFDTSEPPFDLLRSGGVAPVDTRSKGR